MQVWLAFFQATWFALVWSASGLACVILWLNRSSRIFPLLRMLCLCSRARLACLYTGVGCLLAWTQLLLCLYCLYGGLTGFHTSVMVIIIWVLTHNWVYFVALQKLVWAMFATQWVLGDRSSSAQNIAGRPSGITEIFLLVLFVVVCFFNDYQWSCICFMPNRRCLQQL